MVDNKKVIVSLTTWTKRVATSIKTIDSILEQTLKPDLIILNLSLEEFPNKEKDLPEILVEYNKKSLIEINWVNGNTRAFKKLIPTLQKFYGQDYWVLTIDDDLIYRNDYVQMMVDYIRKYDADSFCLHTSDSIGNRMIYNSLAFEKDVWEKLTDEVISYSIDDVYIGYYLKCKKRRISHYRPDNIHDIIKLHDEISPLHDEYNKDNRTRVNEALVAMHKITF